MHYWRIMSYPAYLYRGGPVGYLSEIDYGVSMNKDASAITSSRPGVTKANDTHTRNTVTNGALPKGTVLKKRFLLTNLIATGGTSYIYRARDLLATMNAGESSEIVLKITKHSLNDSTSPTEIALHEALTTRTLAHPNIVQVYDYDCDSKHCFVTMEYLTGESLSTRLQRSVGNKLSYNQAMKIAIPAANALHYAHSQGVVHTDIKPGNIILAAEGVIKVIDFGTARPNSHTGRTSRQAKETDYSGFTPIYASPQTLRDQPATASDDIYSFACTLYEMLAGSLPYNRQTADIAEQKKLKAKRLKAVNIWQWLVLKKALSFRQKARYSDINHFMKLFTRARHVWSGLAILLLTLSLTGYMLDKVINSFSQHKTTDEHLLTLNEDMTQAKDLIERLRKTPALDRIKVLKEAHSLSGIPESAVYQRIRLDLINDVVAEVKQKLYTVSSLEDYTPLTAIINETKHFYPDSAKLSNIEKLIKREQREYASALLITYTEQLDETTFTEQDLKEIQLTKHKLRRFSLETPQPNKHVITRFINELNKSYREYDYVRIDQLITFENRLPLTLPVTIKQKIEIDPLQVEAAQALAQHERKASDKKKEYPQLAAAHFWSSYFDTIDARIKDAWKDKKLYALKQELEEFSKKIPATYLPLIKVHQKLAEQFRSKARYYKRKRIYKKQRRKLNKAADEILSSISGKPYIQ